MKENDLRIEILLEEVVRKRASDLHLQVGLPPMLRVDGTLVPVSGYDALNEEQVEHLIFTILDEEQQQVLAKDKEFDFSFAFGDLGRFRVNAFHERGNLAAALRLIPNEIEDIMSLGMPPIVNKFAEYPRGLVLVTGPTGSGKSTTLAALVDRINTDRAQHIITIEDPIEFTHKSKRSVVVQREVHYDTYSFSAALRSALRQDPDVVLIGEMRDLETISAAITIAETGHLVFATLHTNSAAQSIDRMIDVFPPHQQPQVRAQLANILMAICSQRLVPAIGGVRRSAMISLSDLDDEQVRDAKKGQFYIMEGQRMLSNNSAVYLSKPSTEEFMDEWIALMKSGSGERGIFNRGGLEKTLPKRRLDQWPGGRYPSWGTNPCGEIILQSKQFCNLSEVVARADDTEETLLEKVRIATIIGTYQSTLTYFPYLSQEWKKNCEKERLLGVSITGQWDCALVRKPEMLEKMKQVAIETNKKYAKKFTIPQSTCITCVKPSGTVSQTVDCASGMHARHAPYYIRRIRISATDALFKMLKDQGVPYHPEVGQTLEEATTFVLEFPVKAPEGAICRDDMSAIDQLEHWKVVKKHFTEHNPSVTISVGEDEWVAVANWVYSNWELVGGLSFLPRSNHVYKLAPYEVITKERYEELVKTVEHLDFSKIVTYEVDDETEVKKELACVAGLCEIA
jgi:pilus retraction protein PilT